MQSSNQSDPAVHQYSPVSTAGLTADPVPANTWSPAVGDTEDYPEVTDELSSTVATNPQPPPSALEPHAEKEEKELTLWEGRTSPRIFIVRFLVGEALTVAWVALAVATWGFGYESLLIPAYLSGAALLIFWAFAGVRIFRAIHSHYYRLTNKRLLLTTGFLKRRIDQIELLRVKDLFVQQNILGSWLGLGHVVVISSEQTLPRATLYGIADPRQVMDLIWRQTRDELDRKTSRVESV
jgi:hypothetical protein